MPVYLEFTGPLQPLNGGLLRGGLGSILNSDYVHYCNVKDFVNVLPKIVSIFYFAFICF